MGAVEDPGVGLDAGGAIPVADLTGEYRLGDIQGRGTDDAVRPLSAMGVRG